MSGTNHIATDGERGIIYGMGATPQQAITDAIAGLGPLPKEEIDNYGLRTLPASDSLARLVEDQGGNIPWDVHNGVAMTEAEAGAARATVISAVRDQDRFAVAAHVEAGEFRVIVSPAFAVDGDWYRVVIDGHTAMWAAVAAGVTPELVEATPRDHDSVGLITQGYPNGVDDFLQIHRMRGDADFFDPHTGATIW